jgi:predicted RND superfamily exporter protein
MRIARIVIGVLGLILGVGLIAGAIAGLNQDRDADDFFVTDGDRFERSSFAITSEATEVLTGAPGWVADLVLDPVDIRVSGASNSGGSLFLGIAASSDVERYLADVAYDEVDTVRFEGSDIDYTHRQGTATPGVPGNESFWAASVEGPGLQTLDWSVEQGDWSVVMMNADASTGVDATLVRGVRVSNVVAVLWGAGVFGLLLLLGGGYLVSRIAEPGAERDRVSETRKKRDDWRFVTAKRKKSAGQKFFGWVNRRVVPIAVVFLAATIALAGVADALGSTEEPDFDPSGAMYDIAERAQDVFTAAEGFQQSVFLVEGRDQRDVLTRNAMLEWKANSGSLLADSRQFRGAALNSHLGTVFSTDFDTEIDGVYSVVDAVDDQLAGGLEGATDADVKVALDAVFAAGAPTANLRTTMSLLATAEPAIVAGREIELWESPAFQAFVLWDIDSFEVTTTAAEGTEEFDFQKSLEAQRWLREVQTELRGDQENYTALGLGIDIDLEFEDQLAVAAPFILFAVVIILMVVGALLRSYWAAVYVGAGITATTLIYKGLFALVGLKGGLLLGFIVPISIISFGVDFFIHSTGRIREALVDGETRRRAYPAGMSAVILALTLAALSSAAAFLSNAISGVETIVQFGIGGAIAILVAFVVLGMLAPKLLVATEAALGPNPVAQGPRIFTRLGFAVATLVAGIMVAGAVQFALVGAIALLVFAGLFIYLPFRMTRRRNRLAASSRDIEVSDEVKGVGHGLHFAGYIVHFLARWRVVTIPIVVALAFMGVWGASQVRSDFAFSDFLSKDSDAVRGIDRQEFHFGDLGIGTGYIYVEGDLTEPTTLLAMQATVDEVKASGVDLSRDLDGEIEVTPNAVTLARFATASSAARDDIAATTGVEITDTDANGYPDTAAQVAAVYDAASSDGLRDDAGQVVFSADTVGNILYVDGDTQATRLEFTIGSLTDGPLIDATKVALDDAAANLQTATAGAGLDLVGVSGEPITFRNTLDAFTKSMLLSLPLALILTFLLAAFILRSMKYSLVSVTPILLVVAWVYGFMYLADYTINPVTATIAAISIGVGIDFATHFTARFREELAGEPSRFPALRRAGEGTGGALLLSALTSIAGFAVLGMAPMPIFAVYGVLTAVMIALAVLVSLLVLPSLLLFVTPSLKGEDRERLEWERTRGEWVYDPHRRDTATQTR